jgi:NAD(P)H-hydrate epimerase
MKFDPAIAGVGLPALSPRPAAGHKGTFGKVAIVGGSVGMSGAVCLSSVAALRAGSGLVTAVVPAAIQPLVAMYEPCVMTCGLADSATGLLPVADVQLQQIWRGRDAVAAGPGLGQGPAQLGLVRGLLESCECPLVLDADALNLAAAERLLLAGGSARAGRTIVLTPHPGEFSRLTGLDVSQIEADRVGVASEFARQSGAVVVLKGPGTVVTDGLRAWVNPTGNSGMATAGSGDVLTGIVVSLLGQGLAGFEAAAIAVCAHGLAGDAAADRWTRRALIASDLLDFLPDAWRQLDQSESERKSS